LPISCPPSHTHRHTRARSCKTYELF
jgi:hypothetical protein